MIRLVGTIILVTSIALQTAFAQVDPGKLALAKVVKLGGKVERTPQLDGSDLIGIALGESKITDADFRTLRGLKHVKGCRNLFLQGTRITDEGARVLAEFRDLNVVYLDRTKVTGAGLKGVRVTWLLSLRDAPVTDEGLKALRGHTALPQLDLSGTRITDAGLRELKDLKHLRMLAVRATRVTDAGLAELSALTGLQDLQLNGTKVTDAGMKHLQKLRGLRRLALNGTAVTAAGLNHLKDLPGLRTLALARTKLGDADLAIFTSPQHFKALRDLQVDGTQVTAQGLSRLRKARPGLSAWLPRR
jgi:hypothetical protein